MYITLKFIHILAATIMVGTTAANGILEMRASRRNEAQFSAFSLGSVMVMNYLLMIPSLVVLPLSGILLALKVGFPLDQPWLAYSIFFTGVLWGAFLIGIYMEWSMKRLATESADENAPLPEKYHWIAKRATLVGFSATGTSLATLYMMIAKQPLF